MKVRFGFVLLLFISSAQALGCPQCTYERMMNEYWYEKLFIVKLATVLVFTFNRLDPVRTLYAFLFYTCGYVELYQNLMWHSEPVVAAGFVSMLAMAAITVAELNVLDFGVLWGISQLGFFRKDKSKGLPLWQAAAYCVTAFTLRALL